MPRKLIALLLAITLLAGCAPEPPAATALPSSTPNPTSAPSATPVPTAEPSATPLPSPTPIPVLRFAVTGDYGLAGEAEAAVAQLVKDWKPDIILSVGDNNYPDGQAETIDANIGQYFHEYIGDYAGGYGEGAAQNRFFPVLGNHDWNAQGASAYFDYFTLPGNERYYDFVLGPVHFFAIDSDSREPDGIGVSTPQAGWLQSALAGSTSPWQIVFMHHPPYASEADPNPIPLRWPYADWGAEIVLAGHQHFYERLEVDGFPYIVNGLGGYPARYDFGPTQPGSIVRYRSDFGALFAEATPSSIHFWFVNIHGDVIDEFILNKGVTNILGTGYNQAWLNAHTVKMNKIK